MNKLSKHLRVLVIRNGSELVNVTMPIYSVSVIDTIMPPSILPKIKEKGIDLKAMMTRLKSENYAPQTLFEFESEEKSYRVWIE